MYIVKNQDIPPVPVNTIGVSEIFEQLRKTYGELALPYESSSKGSITIQPSAMRDFSANNPGFMLMYMPNKPATCLWTLKKQIILDASLFYRFNINISSASPIANYQYDLTINNTFTPVYDDADNIDWANAGDHEYMGMPLSNWSSLSSFKWSDLSVNSFINIYKNLPSIITTTTWKLNSDATGEVDDTVIYTISSGQIAYDVQFDISGTVDNMVISNIQITIAGMCSATKQSITSTPTITGTLAATITGEISSYGVTIWNKMDTLLVINMAETTDVLSIYNNGDLPISIYTVTANN